MKYCCSNFEVTLMNDRGRGLAIRVMKDAVLNYGLVFALVHRAVAVEDLRKANLHDQFLIQVEHKAAIRFCPWCGVELRKFYKQYEAELPLVEQIFDTPPTSPRN